MIAVTTKKTIVVIGGGAAGMMASYAGAEQGCHVILLEKNVRLGRKMLITGKGRCNITNECTVPQLVKSMVGNGKFLYSAFSNFSAEDTIGWFSRGGVPLKTERGQRVFPQSDRSADIVNFMERKLRRAGADVRFHAEAKELCVKNNTVTGVRLADHKIVSADAVILATGGISYPLTGSTGDGYVMAERLGHTVNPRFPALVPLVVKEPWIKELEGLSLRNIEVSVKRREKILGKEFGEMVFTDDGLSGPVILTLSRFCSVHFLEHPEEPLALSINLKPALSEKQLDGRLLREFDIHPKRNYRTLLEELLPKKLIPVFVILSGIDPWKQGNQLNRNDRKTIRTLLQAFPFTVISCRPIEEAIITAGGVSVKEVDPKTMASKKVRGLYFAGEILDVDGITGGFNLQAALSMGYQSGISAAKFCQNGT